MQKLSVSKAFTVAHVEDGETTPILSFTPSFIPFYTQRNGGTRIDIIKETKVTFRILAGSDTIDNLTFRYAIFPGLSVNESGNNALIISGYFNGSLEGDDFSVSATGTVNGKTYTASAKIPFQREENTDKITQFYTISQPGETSISSNCEANIFIQIGLTTGSAGLRLPDADACDGKMIRMYFAASYQTARVYLAPPLLPGLGYGLMRRVDTLEQIISLDVYRGSTVLVWLHDGEWWLLEHQPCLPT